jgi:HEAT repeat protein
MGKHARSACGCSGLILAAAVALGGCSAQPAAVSTDSAEGDRAVADVEARYLRESNTREWEMLDGVGSRAWRASAARVICEHPDAARRYVAANEGTEVAGELTLLLGEAGGKENVAFLVSRAEKKPTSGLVLALGRTNDPAARPALRKVMTGRDLTLSWYAAEALARAKDPEMVATLKAWLASKDPDRLRIALAAAEISGARELARAIVDAEPKVAGDQREILFRAAVSCGDATFIDKVHALALDESEYVRESQERSPDPAMAVHVWNYRQNGALNAIAKLASPRSLVTLDRLAASAKDPNIRRRAAEIAKEIRKQSATSTVPQEKGKPWPST